MTQYLRIVTWNINSVRLRIGLLKDLREAVNPDIICLQETKTPNEFFPHADVEALGYTHRVIHGEKGYNGVAILSRVPLRENPLMNFTAIEQCRHISAFLPNGTELHNFYVPAGGDEPDVTINPKFAHKLDFVDHMHDWFKDMRKTTDKMILVGDLNIAPLEHDVWSHKQLLKIVSHTPIEVEKLTRLQRGLEWVDVARHFVPADQKLYSWWSYRNKDWKASDRGRRLDHIWVTPALKENLKSLSIHKPARDWEGPSDHVPVVMEIAV